ncbi:F-box family protein with DUF295 [Prunus dulcis]|uniref:F-box family protein with DUF295 n=1 Tax=Prunus dulcis TaxID=3755 RepID=A0A4Y1RNH5_PRUDU|nr:F-box family protein with DUF295 [Prunus dulcis]
MRFTNLIFRDNQASGARQNYKRDLRGIEVARTICEVGPMSTDIQSDYSSVSALDFASRVSGRSDRECQDLRLGRLGVPRPARIAARLTLCPRDLPGLRIRLTTSNEVLKDFELSLFKDDFQPFYIGLSVIARKCIGSTTGPLLTSTLQSQVKFWNWSKYRGDSAEFSAEVEEKFEKNLR